MTTIEKKVANATISPHTRGDTETDDEVQGRQKFFPFRRTVSITRLQG
jgi:hypothetical protein